MLEKFGGPCQPKLLQNGLVFPRAELKNLLVTSGHLHYINIITICVNNSYSMGRRQVLYPIELISDRILPYIRGLQMPSIWTN
jgi:hypothetical protein